MKIFLLLAAYASPLAALMATALFMLSGCTREAEPPPPTPSTAFGVSDKEMFATYCASCHGLDAKGEGPVAPLLTVPPPDLTQIRARRGGDFPVDELYSMIDGREQVLAHGTREMPVWGNALRTIDGVPQSEEAVEQRINLLIEYLRSIQEEGEG